MWRRIQSPTDSSLRLAIPAAKVVGPVMVAERMCVSEHRKSSHGTKSRTHRSWANSSSTCPGEAACSSASPSTTTPRPIQGTARLPALQPAPTSSSPSSPPCPPPRARPPSLPSLPPPPPLRWSRVAARRDDEDVALKVARVVVVGDFELLKLGRLKLQHARPDVIPPIFLQGEADGALAHKSSSRPKAWRFECI